MPEESQDNVTEVSSTSWLQRIGQSFIGVLVGLALVPLSAAGLWWNEGRAVTTARSLAEGAAAVQTVPADRVDPAFEGKLVHVSGEARTTAPVGDEEFGVSAPALKLVRRVEMYQWKEDSRTETRDKLGGGQERVTTYSYSRSWVDRPVDSGRFHNRNGHENPPMAWQTRETVARDATLGAFRLPEILLNQLPRGEALALDEQLPRAVQRRVGKPAQIADGALYVGGDPQGPRIGDYRIRYEVVRPQAVSIVARQAGNSFAPYQTRAGDAVAMLDVGTVTAAQMFKEAQDENAVLTWILRAVGAVAMMIGFSMIMGPLRALAAVIPFLGDIVGAGAGLVSLAMTAVLAPLVIGFAWLFYRPLVGALVLAVGGAIAWLLLRTARQRGVARSAAMPAAGPVSRGA